MHPITPPPELVQQWDEEGTTMLRPAYQTHLTTRAAQWGADQELEACCKWLKVEGYPGTVIDLRATRRPEPPSLKEQAIAELDEAVIRGDCLSTSSAVHTIRRALEALDD
jgi:hypothetical protein